MGRNRLQYTAADVVLLPEPPTGTPSGSAMLCELTRQADALTALLCSLTAETDGRITFDALLREYTATHPGAVLDPALLHYTGRRVIIDEDAFFSWYAGTPEGEAYLTRCSSFSDLRGGRLAVIKRK